MKCTPFLTFLLISCVSFGQNLTHYVFPVQGGWSVLDNMTISWTLGENITSSEKVGETIYTQGFQQPFFQIELIGHSANKSLAARIYPNPAEGILYIALDRIPKHELSYEIYNTTGSLVQETKSDSLVYEINVSNFTQGQYILVIRDPIESVQSSYSIIKQ